VDDPKYLSVREAARRVGVSASLVYQWCSDGTLPHYRLGGNGKRGKIVIDPTELDTVFKARRVTATVALPAMGHIRVR
jgi:excisionase family DNA binding protein